MNENNRKLIFDIGLHTGRDSDFYLRKGFDVVAVEANPEIAARARAALKSYANSGQLKIVEKALFEKSGEHVTFFVNDEKDDWSSLSQGVAEKGVTSSRPITVETITLADIYGEYGVPYYLKCDIEGGDESVAKQMASFGRLPEYASFEITSVSMLGILWGAGYRRFQLVNQAFNYLTVPPDPALEGNYVQHSFDGHTSGCFGKELKDSRWVGIEEVTGLYLDFVRLRDRYEQLCMGWLDVHATH